MRSAGLIALALCLGTADAFAPSRLRPGTARRAAAETESEPAPAPAPAAPSPASKGVLGQLTSFAEAEMPVCTFKPRDRSEWAQGAGYGKFADTEESKAYQFLKSSQAGDVEFLKPLIESTKTRPAILDGTHAGDYGFDPLGFAKSEDLLYFYMESEVKHSRLAMLACAGWIGAELAHGKGLAEHGRAPALLNGHLFDLGNFFFVLLAFGAWGYFEHMTYPAQYIKHTPNNGKYNYIHYEDGPYAAGNYDFDPLGLYSSLGDDAAGRRAMRDLEVAHGRFAMTGLTLWVLFEALTTAPVADAFGCFFKPFWKWGLPFLGENGVVGTIEFLAVLGAIGYAGYDTVMQTDSMKYQGDGNPDFTFFGDKKD